MHLARARHRVVHSRRAVGGGGDELAARRVEGHVQNLVGEEVEVKAVEVVLKVKVKQVYLAVKVKAVCTSSLCPRSEWMHSPVLTFHTLHVRSVEPEMHSSAEKSNCVDEISPRWPESVCKHWPFIVSHTCGGKEGRRG